MDMDDLDPIAKKAPSQQLGSLPLDPLSVAELEDYIRRLEAEIVRARTAIAAKQGTRSNAEALFSKR